jgi:hypothetical protein
MRELRWAVASEHQEAFYTQIEGWWHSRVIGHLLVKDRQTISGTALQQYIFEVAKQYREDNLPIEFDTREPNSLPDPDTDDRMFVKQLRLISCGPEIIRNAMLNYWRISEQRGHWLREELLGLGEWPRYHQKLKDEWKIHFNFMLLDANLANTPQAKAQLGLRLFEWAETRAPMESGFWIRPQCKEPFVTRGTFHLLADVKAVGWHPDYDNLLVISKAPPKRSRKKGK